MTTTRTVAHSKAKGLRARQLLQLVLASKGIRVERRAEVHDGEAGTGTDRERGDLLGLERWAVMTRFEHRLDFSGGLDSAVAAAEHDGKPRAACVWYRPSREPEEAFVVMRLSDFAAVLIDEAGRDV